MMTTADLPRALLFGSTGLVGSYLLAELQESDKYREVIAFNRRPSLASGSVATEVVDGLEHAESLRHHFKVGDHIYIALGTTIRKAGSIEKMNRIDRELPVAIARIGFESGADRLAVVSSLGANAGSRNYYMRIKGRMEVEISEIPFRRTIIARPGILLGPRKEFRFGEAVGKAVMQALSPVMLGGLRRYRGIQARDVARAMVIALNQGEGLAIVESEILKEICHIQPAE